jgi:DNA-binding PadR family transcriptional regulator
MATPDPRTFLPLKPVDLELLLALAVQAISEHTNGLVVLDPGNLYRVIKRLLTDGLIAESGREATDAGERRKYYRITPLGGRVLTQELQRLRRLVGATSTREAVRRWTS